MPEGFDGSGSSADSSAPESGDHCEDHRIRQGLGEHLKARGELLALEAREASEALARRGTCAIAAILLLGIGYGLFLVAGVFLLGRWIDHLFSSLSGYGWQVSAVAAGLGHLILSLGLFRRLKRQRNLNLFQFTRAEFNKDGKWLNQVSNTSSRNKSSS